LGGGCCRRDLRPQVGEGQSEDGGGDGDGEPAAYSTNSH
jgi:hypothetical protein